MSGVEGDDGLVPHAPLPDPHLVLQASGQLNNLISRPL